MVALCYQTVICLVTMVFRGQTVGWVKVTPGMQVGLGLGDNVLDGHTAPPSPQKGHSSPTFRPMSVVAKQLDVSRFHLVWR